jgi:signal transduction histidine kinase/ligand-binding sensor domain-containing protein
MNLPRSRHRVYLAALFLSLGMGAFMYTPAKGQARSELLKQLAPNTLAHQAWSSENGLPQNSVHQILQTRDGYIWIATEGGVARFNGIQFTVFNQESDPAFTSNDTCCLAEDRSGALWIGTADGLLRYFGGAFHRYTTSDGLPSLAVLSLVSINDGLLVNTSGGAARYNGQGFTPLALSPSAIGFGSNGSAWVATATGLFSYSREHLRAEPLVGLPAEAIEGLGSLKDGSLWARTRTALLLWKQGRLHIWHAGGELPGTRVQSFLADSLGDLWIGTDQGLATVSFRDRTESDAPLAIQAVMGATSILTLFEDQEDNLWVGTDTAGLHILRHQKFRTLPALAGSSVAAISQTSDGAIWSATKGEGLFRFEDGKTHRLSTKDGLLSDIILTLAADRDGSLWLGTADGLNHLQSSGKIESYTSSDGLPDDFIRSLFSDADGSLWLGTRRGLAHWKDGRFIILSRADGLKSDLIGAMLRSSSNDLWVATLDGLVRIRDGKLTTFTRAQGLSGDVITSLLEDTNHTLWVGTKDGGLSRSLADGFSRVRAPDLPSDINAIVEDADGYLWLASARGIVRVLATELMACGTGLECHPHVATYGSSDGMPTEETSSDGHPGAWKMTDGQLWFATRKGVAIVSSIDLSESHTPPPVILERFTVDDSEWKMVGGEATIPPGHTRYAFEYAGLSYISPLRVRYRYILEGFDKQWTQAGTRRNAYYTNLPARHYRFRVQAANEDGIWNETGAEFSFVIQPPFYRTLWFLVLSAILLAGVVFAAYRMRVRVIRSKFDAILAERSRIAREIHDTLAQGFVGVSVQLELTAHLLAQSHVAEASQQVDRTREFVREGLADARRSIWDLRAASTQATLPIRLAHLAEQNSVEHMKIDIAVGGIYRALTPSLENEVLRIAQEAIANAVRHSKATHVDLNLRYDPSELTLTITDNGVGFQSTDTTLPAKGHFGLQGMRERASQIGGTLTVESSPKSGTTITLRAPLENGKE